MRFNTISIKGPYLPSIGGVSIHISRLAELLSNDGLMGCLYNTSNSIKTHELRYKVRNVFYSKLRYGIFQSLLWFFLHGIKDKARIFHLHGNPIWEAPTLMLMVLFNKNIVYTIHDQMILDDINKYPGLLISFLKKLLEKKSIHWIAVNQKIKDQIFSINANCKRINVIPAYLHAKSDFQLLNTEIEDFIKTKSHILSIYANATRIYNGKDLYGIDLALKALPKVINLYPNTGLVISIPGETINSQIKEYQNIIEEYNLQNNVLIFLKPINNSINLWRKSKIVLRPTLTDGDSLVIREALDEGIYVVASDVVERPHGVILFQSENVVELAEKIICVLKSDKNNIRKSNLSNYEHIKEVYSLFL